MNLSTLKDAIFFVLVSSQRNRPKNLSRQLLLFHQQIHNAAAATAGSVQQRFHGSSYGRNESLVIVRCYRISIYFFHFFNYLFQFLCLVSPILYPS